MTHNILRAVDLRDRTKLIVSGKVLTGFSVVKMLAMGADVCNAARAMMFALGCIQVNLVNGLLRDHTGVCTVVRTALWCLLSVAPPVDAVWCCRV